jgi:site-specific recombinase XerC
LFSVFLDAGGRLAEISNLRYMPDDPENNDVDLDQGVLRMVGKGGRMRILPVGSKTVRALDRYLRKRAQHPDARLPWLWLSRRGRLTASGIRQMMERRGKQAGIGAIHPHQFRHTFAQRDTPSRSDPPITASR